MDEEKKYIPVLVRHDEKGNMRPVAIEWNGHVVGVDKAFDACRAPSLKHGGYGQRWTVRIRSTMCYIFYDDGKWFLERA